jgi:hypothetical protein
MPKPKKKPKKKPSVKEQIESTPEIAKKEAAFYKASRRELVDVSKDRRPTRVSYSRHLYLLDDFIIHTHPSRGASGSAVPSTGDILNFLGRADGRTDVVAVVDKKGKLIGRTYLKMREKGPAAQKRATQLSRQWRKIMKSENASARMDWLKESGLKIRFESMPGYWLNEKTYRFQKLTARQASRLKFEAARKKKLQKKVRKRVKQKINQGKLAA